MGKPTSGQHGAGQRECFSQFREDRLSCGSEWFEVQSQGYDGEPAGAVASGCTEDAGIRVEARHERRDGVGELCKMVLAVGQLQIDACAGGGSW